MLSVLQLILINTVSQGYHGNLVILNEWPNTFDNSQLFFCK